MSTLDDPEGEDDMADDVDTDLQAHTVRLELIDRPGELLRALEPIANHGGNLLSIFHERGNMTPRGHIPVEVDLECPPDRFEVIVDALRDAGINVMEAGAQRYEEELVVLLVGDLVETDLSDTIGRIETCSTASVVDLALAAADGSAELSSARVRLAVESGSSADTLAAVRKVADDKGFSVIEPSRTEAEP